MIRSKPDRDAAAALHARRLRFTPQRFAVLDYVARHPVHATADEVFRGVNQADPRASRATVYNSLHALVRAGLVREVRVDGKAARFDANLDAHHHFVCEICGSVEDITRVPPGLPHGPALEGHIVTGYEIVFRGHCPECVRKEKEKRNG